MEAMALAQASKTMESSSGAQHGRADLRQQPELAPHEERRASSERRNEGGREPEAKRTKLVSWQYKVCREHVRTTYARLQQERMMDDTRSGAIHSMPTSRTKSGIVLAT